MSFNQSRTGALYAPGWFLAEEECSRHTRNIAYNHAQVATAANGGKYVPMGAFYPANDSSTVEGIVYEDVDVTTGSMPGSVVTKGVVYLDRLPAAPESGVQSALEGKGFKFYTTSPAVTRPSGTAVGTMGTLTVASAAGTNVGDTKITITETLGSGNSYVYKTNASKAPTIGYGVIPDYTWTAWDGSADITATTGHKITICKVNAEGRAIASGSQDVTSKAQG